MARYCGPFTPEDFYGKELDMCLYGVAPSGAIWADASTIVKPFFSPELRQRIQARLPSLQDHSSIYLDVAYVDPETPVICGFYLTETPGLITKQQLSTLKEILTAQDGWHVRVWKAQLSKADPYLQEFIRTLEQTNPTELSGRIGVDAIGNDNLIVLIETVFQDTDFTFVFN